MVGIIVPFNGGNIDLTKPGKFVNVRIASTGTVDRFLDYSTALAGAFGFNAYIKNVSPKALIPNDWKDKKSSKIFLPFHHSDIKRMIVCDATPLCHKFEATQHIVKDLQDWTRRQLEKLINICDVERVILIFDQRDSIVVNNNLDEIINSELVAMGAAYGVYCPLEEIPVSLYDVLHYENRAVLTEVTYNKIKSFMGTDSMPLGTIIMDGCNIPKSIIYLLLLLNELKCNLYIKSNSKEAGFKVLFPRLYSYIKEFTTLKDPLSIDLIVNISEAVLGRTLYNDEKLFIAENYKTNAIKSKAFDIKFKLKQRLQK